MSRTYSRPIVAGIDVGGPRKGFHAVALRHREVRGTFASRNACEVADWCKQADATILGVDAPSGWSRSDRARMAERSLMKSGISCFSTPSEQVARQHSGNFYAWMLNGVELYAALGNQFRLFNGRNAEWRPLVFETFPQAIACALAGTIVSARDKRTVRRALLEKSGLCSDTLTNIDWIDAALCALMADRFGHGGYRQHGDAVEGYIVVPD